MFRWLLLLVGYEAALYFVGQAFLPHPTPKMWVGLMIAMPILVGGGLGLLKLIEEPKD